MERVNALEARVKELEALLRDRWVVGEGPINERTVMSHRGVWLHKHSVCSVTVSITNYMAPLIETFGLPPPSSI